MIKTKELTNAVSAAMGGCRTATDGKNLYFHEGFIFSWSSALSALVKLPAGCEHLEGVMASSDLFAFLSKLKKSEIEIECGDTWTITAKNMTTELNQTLDDKLIEKVAIMKKQREGMEWKALPENFYEALLICTIPGNKTALTGVYAQDNMMYSTDGIRFHQCDLGGSMGDVPIYISNVSAQEIIKVPTHFTHFLVANHWAYFAVMDKESGTPVIIYAANRLDESSYNIKAVSAPFIFLTSGKFDGTAESTFPKGIENGFDTAQIFDDQVIKESGTGDGNGFMKVVTLKFDKKDITVMSQTDKGKYTEKFPYEDGQELDIEEPVTIKLNTGFLKEALSRSRKFVVGRLNTTMIIWIKGAFYNNIVSGM